MTEDFVAAADWLKARPESTGKLGAVGFCFGGGMVEHAGRAHAGSRRGGAVLRRGSRTRPTCRRSRRRCCCTTASTTRGSIEAWPAYEAALKANKMPVRGVTSIRRRSTASTTTRRRATTKPPPSWPGSGRSIGSTSTFRARQRLTVEKEEVKTRGWKASRLVRRSTGRVHVARRTQNEKAETLHVCGQRIVHPLAGLE